MNKNIVIILVLALVIVGGYFLYQLMTPTQTSTVNNQETNQTPLTNNQNESDEAQTETETPTGATHQVIYTDSGYTPSAITIKVGDTVNFKNESSQDMWTASAMHPSHSVYSGTSLQQHCPEVDNTSFDECKSDQPGTVWSFTFTKKGEWGYHNHVKAGHYGKVIVE